MCRLCRGGKKKQPETREITLPRGVWRWIDVKAESNMRSTEAELHLLIAEAFRQQTLGPALAGTYAYKPEDNPDERVTVHFDCADIEIANFLFALYKLYQDEGISIELSETVAFYLPRAIAYLRDQLSYHVLDEAGQFRNKLFVSGAGEGFDEFAIEDVPLIKQFVSSELKSSDD